MWHDEPVPVQLLFHATGSSRVQKICLTCVAVRIMRSLNRQPKHKAFVAFFHGTRKIGECDGTLRPKLRMAFWRIYDDGFLAMNAEQKKGPKPATKG